MLKITFAETGLFLEYLTDSVETLVADRARLYVRAYRPLVVQPITANLPLPSNLPGLHTLTRFSEISLSQCDRHWWEVSLPGLWVAESPEQAEGVFVAELHPHLEQRLLRLWQLSQAADALAIR